MHHSFRVRGGRFVLCVYDANKKIYLEEVQEINHDYDRVSISFMSLTCR